MDIFNVLALVGGLAMFLFGMNVLGDGLEKLSGGKLERILERLTSNVFKGVLLGAAVTAVIQSSSATTVMVVGFVNSGIMKLHQAIGIIMGANIGTTVTSWILSLSGIEGDSVFIRLLKPSSFTPVLAVVGIIFIMFCKNGKKRDIGMILLGFTVLMVGMDSMSAAVKPLANVPEFTNILTMFSNPVLGVLAGAALTAIIQSSSASVGILQALSATGAIKFTAAVPIILGQNIGTCVTALLSSVGANKNARRAALVHLYFNIIGTTLFLILYYILTNLIDFTFVNETIDATGIAIVHSIFNVFATLVLLPFTRLLEKLAYLTIREDKNAEQDEFRLLDSRFLSTPSFAIQQCRTLSNKMAEKARDNLYLAMSMIEKYDAAIDEQIMKNEDEIDLYDDKLGTYLVKLSSMSLSIGDSSSISLLQHSNSDFERISDHAVNVLESAREKERRELKFSNKGLAEFQIFNSAVKEIVGIAVEAYSTNNLALAANVEPLEEVVDELRGNLKKRHLKRLRKGKCSVDMGFVWSDLLTNYERIADHCSNIAVSLIQIHENSFETHEYLNELKKTSDISFSEKFLAYSEKYALPKSKADEI